MERVAGVSRKEFVKMKAYAFVSKSAFIFVAHIAWMADVLCRNRQGL